MKLSLFSKIFLQRNKILNRIWLLSIRVHIKKFCKMSNSAKEIAELEVNQNSEVSSYDQGKFEILCFSISKRVN